MWTRNSISSQLKTGIFQLTVSLKDGLQLPDIVVTACNLSVPKDFELVIPPFCRFWVREQDTKDG